MTKAKFFRLARRLSAIVALFALAQTPMSAWPAARWAINPARTHIAFAIDSLGYPRTKGEFRHFEGRISIDFEHPNRSSVEFRVQSESVDVGSPSFDDYLRSDAFLNAARYPSIDFVSRSVEKIDENTVRVSGELTLLGVTRPLTVDVVVRRETGAGAERFSFQAKTSINRLEFGMNSGFPLVSNAVELVISSEAVEL